MASSIMVEGGRWLLEITKGSAVTGDALTEGLLSIKGFTADGLIPPLTTTKTDWLAADQDVVW